MSNPDKAGTFNLTIEEWKIVVEMYGILEFLHNLAMEVQKDIPGHIALS